VISKLEEDKEMLKRILIVTTLVLLVTLTAVASDRDDDVNRTNKATQVFKEIMNTPDQGIPQELLESAKCIAIIPGDVKFAFIFGGNYGRGLATCRTGHGWSAPVFLALEGGSVGYQIGGSSTDIVMLFMNDHALKSLLSDKFKLGADATVAAGPVGRNAAAGTDLKLNAEILSYSRSKGLFAGVSLNGAVVQTDKSGDEAMYGHDVNRHEILDGKVAVPESAQALLHEIGGYAHEAKLQ
jgi:lipid-binding SYLF domain-containing protein